MSDHAELERRLAKMDAQIEKNIALECRLRDQITNLRRGAVAPTPRPYWLGPAPKNMGSLVNELVRTSECTERWKKERKRLRRELRRLTSERNVA
jgi:hypothetical protein